MSQDIYCNDNLDQVLVQKVECCFAPEGKKHYIVAMLDADHNVQYLASQCEEEHGEEVIAGVAEKEGQTCHDLVMIFRKYLKGESASNSWEKRRAEEQRLGPVLGSFAKAVKEKADGARNSRESIRYKVNANPVSTKVSALQRIVNHVTHNQMLIVEKASDSDAIFLWLASGHNSIGPSYCSEIIATWTSQGWDVASQYQKDYSHGGDYSIPTKLSNLNFPEHLFQRGLSTGGKGNKCRCCNETFDRMGRHKDSSRHYKESVATIERVLKICTIPNIRAMNKHGGVKIVRVKKVNIPKDFKVWIPRNQAKNPNRFDGGGTMRLYQAGFQGIAIRRVANHYRCSFDKAEYAIKNAINEAEWIEGYYPEADEDKKVVGSDAI